MNLDFGGRRRPSAKRVTLIVAGGMLLGALLTELATLVPPGPPREFFITTVAASLGPLTIDLLVVAVTLGPLVLRVNFLSLVGILLLAWFSKSLL